jgi:hypothetical protein
MAIHNSSNFASNHSMQAMEAKMASMQQILDTLVGHSGGELRNDTPEWPPTTGPLTHIKNPEVPVGPFKAGQPAVYQFQKDEAAAKMSKGAVSSPPQGSAFLNARAGRTSSGAVIGTAGLSGASRATKAQLQRGTNSSAKMAPKSLGASAGGKINDILRSLLP